ncbi:MAG: hypothetical protein ACF788_11095 [Novipirellula sp. JB048]
MPHSSRDNLTPRAGNRSRDGLGWAAAAQAARAACEAAFCSA